jgi:hypothetical protein
LDVPPTILENLWNLCGLPIAIADKYDIMKAYKQGRNEMKRWKVTLRSGGVDMMVAANEVDVWIRFGDRAVEVELIG